jgi:hypothetical protein
MCSTFKPPRGLPAGSRAPGSHRCAAVWFMAAAEQDYELGPAQPGQFSASCQGVIASASPWITRDGQLSAGDGSADLPGPRAYLRHRGETLREKKNRRKSPVRGLLEMSLGGTTRRSLERFGAGAMPCQLGVAVFSRARFGPRPP